MNHKSIISYQNCLADLLDFTKGKRILTASDVSRYTGKDRRWCIKHLGISRDGISANVLAEKLVNL